MPDARVVILRDPPPPFGGVRVSAAQTAALLRELPGVEYTEARFDSHPGSFLEAAMDFAKALRGADAVLFQTGDFLSLARARSRAFLFIARLFGKTVVFRGFAGAIREGLEAMPPRRRRAVLRAARALDLVTFQTRADVAYFGNLLRGCRVVWLPNAREAPGELEPPRPEARRFCFFGKVSRAKGVDILAEAAVGLPAEISIDVYGDFAEGEEGGSLRAALQRSGANYGGVVAPENIPTLLRDYDALLLPTTWRTEGYPGVVLEAFAAGVPVIVTRWNALPELVDDSCGRLVPPRDSAALKAAILGMHDAPETWKSLRRGAHARIAEFEPRRWAARLHQWILEAASARGKRSS